MNYLLPGQRRVPHALLGQRRGSGRRGAVLRALRHRQDHPFGRPPAPPDRRRRARLERQRRLQLRGRMLRQVHPALAGATSRRSGTPSASARSSKTWRWTRDTRLLDFDSDEITENTRAAYPLEFIDNAMIPSVGGPSRERHLPDRRRVRRSAADLAADAGAGHVSLPERLYGQGGGHGARLGQGAGSDFQRLLRRAVPAPAGGRLRFAAGREAAALPAPAAGW